MTGTVTIGIDVGGTFVRAGIVTRDGRVGAVVKCLTPRNAKGESLIDALARVVDQVSHEGGDRRHTIDAIGLGLPGIIDEENGRLLRSLNIPGVEGYPLADDLSDRVRLPVRLMTDMQAATWAEYTMCEPSPRRFAHLRLGTGVGLCLVTNGRLEQVNLTRTTHHPMLVVDRSTRAIPCPCGLRGCLENIASARALAGVKDCRNHAEALARLRSGCEAANAEARDVMERATNAIVQALRQVVNEHHVDHICLGGGVTMALPHLVDCIIARLEHRDGTAAGKSNAIVQ